MPWKRPADVPLGQVWSRFNGRNKLIYQIRDMDEHMQQTCLDMMQAIFLRDEPLCKVLEVTKDSDSVKTLRTNWESYVSQNVSLACFTEVDGQPDRLIGVNILLVKCRDDMKKDSKVKGEVLQKFQYIRSRIMSEETFNIFEYYEVDKYLTSSGITILPEFRGQDIGAHMLAARESLCKTLGIEVTASIFTAKSSQTLAEKCGYEVLTELKYCDMIQHGIDLTGCSSPCAKLMGTKFNFD